MGPVGCRCDLRPLAGQTEVGFKIVPRCHDRHAHGIVATQRRGEIPLDPSPPRHIPTKTRAAEVRRYLLWCAIPPLEHCLSLLDSLERVSNLRCLVEECWIKPVGAVEPVAEACLELWFGEVVV